MSSAFSEIAGADAGLAREAARRSLYAFSRWMFLARRGYRWQRAGHHEAICAALMRVYRGETRRLIINVPPRYSKTELAVVNFIAWALGQSPDAEFIHTSYSATLASNNAGAIRALVQHEEYRALFPATELATEAQHHWRTTSGGVLYAVGAGGTITGFGAGKMRDGFGGAIIIDDPHKADEARSDVIRQGVIEWFQNTLESRKNSPETPIVLIMQRLHEKDLSGWLLGGGNGERWEHLCLSAWADEAEGRPLWPEKHSAEELRRMEEASPYVFAGQYRQRPAPPAGGMFKPDRIEVVDALPSAVSWVRGWDLASTEARQGADPDWTAGVRLGRLADGRYIVGDVTRLRESPDGRDAAIRNAAARDGKATRISIPQDPGQAGKSQVLAFARLLAGYPLHTSPESGDKITRAEAFAAQVNVGNVLMLRGEWNDAYTGELRMFPNGAHDDQVDGSSRAFSALLEARTPSVAATRIAGL